MPEVIPEAVVLIGAFFLIVMAMFLRGALAGWNYSFGSIFVWLDKNARVTVPIPFAGHVTINFGSPFGVLNQFIFDTFQAGINDCERYAASCWHAAEAMLRYTTEAIDWLARETAATFDWLATVHIPRWVKLIAGPFLLPLLLPRILKYVQAHIHVGMRPITQYVTNEFPKEITRLSRKAIEAAIPGAMDIPWIEKEVYGLTKRNLNLAKRLRQLEAITGAAVFAGLMANAIGGISARCVRSGAVGKVARALCGLPARALEDLLGLLVDLFIFENICEAVSLMEQAFNLVVPAITDFLASAEAQFVHCGYDLVPNGTVPAPALPPVTGLTLNPD